MSEWLGKIKSAYLVNWCVNVARFSVLALWWPGNVFTVYWYFPCLYMTILAYPFTFYSAVVWLLMWCRKLTAAPQQCICSLYWTSINFNHIRMKKKRWRTLIRNKPHMSWIKEELCLLPTTELLLKRLTYSLVILESTLDYFFSVAVLNMVCHKVLFWGLCNFCYIGSSSANF